MTTRMSLVATAALLAMGLAACGTTAQGESDVATEATAEATQTPRPSRTPRPTPTPTPTPAECPAATDESAVCQIVLGTANVFGAGVDALPAPGGGGAGTAPTMWLVPAGATTMTVTEALGAVEPIAGIGMNGAEGDLRGPVNVASWEGISGIVHDERGMFLTGVFLTDEAPAGEGPERLTFTDQESFEELAPEIAQTFFIGDGAGRTFIVPTGATRLFLGFVDAYYYQGEPGWYNNNRGQLAVSVDFTTD